MALDHLWTGVGLDNFLYAYRGRYIFDAAWQEPNLSHPHNIILDIGTRLGLFGLLAGGWISWILLNTLWKLQNQISGSWRPISVGLGGALVYILTHGLVDHSFFLIDLAYGFHLILGIMIWLQKDFQQKQNFPKDT